MVEGLSEILEKINYTDYLDMNNKEQFFITLMPLVEKI